jgi:hypothetical protein
MSCDVNIRGRAVYCYSWGLFENASLRRFRCILARAAWVLYRTTVYLLLKVQGVTVCVVTNKKGVCSRRALSPRARRRTHRDGTGRPRRQPRADRVAHRGARARDRTRPLERDSSPRPRPRLTVTLVSVTVRVSHASRHSDHALGFVSNGNARTPSLLTGLSHSICMQTQPCEARATVLA